MGCFVATVAEAVVTTALQKRLEKKEKAEELRHIDNICGMETETEHDAKPAKKISWSRKLKWLNTMLWGGSALLVVEHIWHGEVVPWPPFLTAMSTPSEIGPMLHEIATYGTAMAVTITAVWFGMTLVADRLAERNSAEPETELQK